MSAKLAMFGEIPSVPPVYRRPQWPSRPAGRRRHPAARVFRGMYQGPYVRLCLFTKV